MDRGLVKYFFSNILQKQYCSSDWSYWDTVSDYMHWFDHALCWSFSFRFGLRSIKKRLKTRQWYEKACV